MGDKHLDTIPATESDDVIKSRVEDLVPILSESEGKNGCDVPSCFTTFSNILFDDEYEFESVDDQSLHNEDFSDRIFSNLLFEEEISSIKKNQHHFNAESDLVESMLNHDSSIISFSSKIDSLLNELLYDNSSPGPPEEFNSKNSNAEIESFSPSPIPDKDSDSFMEEIDLFLTPDDPMSPSIEDDEDSEGDILFERLLHDDPIPPRDTLDFSYEVRIFLPFFTYPYSRKLEDSCQRILSSKSSFPQLQLGIILLHLAGSQPMSKSSYKAEKGVIISIPSLVGGVADVVVEIKGTGQSISITFQFSVGLQTPDDLSRSRLGFIEKMGVHG
nr:hypothetical protein [Tanacetum cinerariifolium]